MKQLLCALVCALTLVGCGKHSVKVAPVQLHDPFRNADGSLNVPAVLTAAQFGLNADCAIPNAITQDVCVYGKSVLKAAQGIQAKDPETANGAILALLTQAAKDQPKFAPYVNFAVQLIGGAVQTLGN